LYPFAATASGWSWALLRGGVERLVARQDSGELLGDPGTEVLELGDLDVLDARVRHRQLGRVVGIDRLERVQRHARRSMTGPDELGDVSAPVRFRVETRIFAS
jgi:hypothetical protein